jgi:autotransporter strand-loop-strand O-heptosyltransferase
VIYSKEEDGYMGNFLPKGASRKDPGSLKDLIEDMLSCEFFVGVGSGLSWLSWSINLPLVLISGFSDSYSEMETDVVRIINKKGCYGCFNAYRLDAGDWNWCPVNKGTEKMFECTKNISSAVVIDAAKKLINDRNA